MKIVRFVQLDGTPQLGVVEQSGHGSQQSVVYRVIEGESDLLDLIRRGEDSLRAAGEIALERGPAVEASGVQNLAPIATPPTFRDFYAFEQHVKNGRKWRGLEMDPLWYQIPVFYFSNPYAVRGEGEVPMAPGAQKFDFELEVAAIIGREGSDLTAEEGDDAIVGYAILNDWSARDIQQEEMKLSMGPVKGKDTATSIGPWFVTKDELEPYRTATGFDRTMTLSVNGVEYSRANWSDVYFSFGEMVSYASRGTFVRPGDIFGSGTCGTGCILELSRSFGSSQYPWLKAGDEVVASVDGLGSQRSVIVAANDAKPFRHKSAEG